MTQIKPVTPEQLKKLQEAQDKWIQTLKAEGKVNLASAARTISAEETITAAADASVNFWVLKGHVHATLDFGSGKKVNFDGWPWGFGQGLLQGIGVYYGVGPDTLIGGCHYHCQWGAAGGGIIQITMWRDGIGALGQVNTAAAGEGVGETGGNDGVFAWA